MATGMVQIAFGNLAPFLESGKNEAILATGNVQSKKKGKEDDVGSCS